MPACLRMYEKRHNTRSRAIKALTHVCTYIHSRMHLDIYPDICTYTYPCIHTHAQTHIHAALLGSAGIFAVTSLLLFFAAVAFVLQMRSNNKPARYCNLMYLCAYTHIYIHIYTYIYIHTYIYIYHI